MPARVASQSASTAGGEQRGEGNNCSLRMGVDKFVDQTARPHLLRMFLWVTRGKEWGEVTDP